MKKKKGLGCVTGNKCRGEVLFGDSSFELWATHYLGQVHLWQTYSWSLVKLEENKRPPPAFKFPNARKSGQMNELMR